LIGFIIAYWWLLLIESLAVAGVVGILSLGADKLVGREPSNLSALKLSMLVTAIAMFTAYMAIIVGLYKYLGGAGSGASSIVVFSALLSAILLLFQWLLGPYMVNSAYRTRPPRTSDELAVERILERVARESGIKPPRLRIVESRVPNAFAYSSPIAGSYVAVTRGLIRIAGPDEIEAVLGHEVGHLKHRDVSWILALSIVPLMVYFLGRSLLYAGLVSGGSRDRDDAGGAYLMLIGLSLIIASVLFKFMIAHFNRLREYYADAHSALVTRRPRALQRALAKIYVAVKKDPVLAVEATRSSIAAPLFIVSPLIMVNGGFFTDIDYLVETLKEEKADPVEELFSTHPPVPKRLRFLDRLAAALI